MHPMRNRHARALLLTFVLALPLIGSGAMVTNIYFTRFEETEPPGGYNPAFELVGQKGWLRFPAVYGGNGIITNFLGSQAAYIGLFPLQPLTNSLSVYRQINYTPPPNTRTLVKFSVLMDIEDSSDQNGKYDQFWWTLYNGWGDPLFTVNFDNDNWEVSYGLDDGLPFVYSGVKFTNGVVYQLLVTMDFQSNRWSAILSNEVRTAVLASNQPLTTLGMPLNFGDMDAIWIPRDPQNPGNNFMIFDDYSVSAEIRELTSARLLVLGEPSGGNFPMRMVGPNGERFAIEVSADLAQWIPLKTNTVTDGAFDFVDANPGGASPRFFRARLVP